MVHVHSGPGYEALRDHINKEYQAGNYEEEWRNLPEVPSTSEIWSAKDPVSETRPPPEAWNAYQAEPVYSETLPHNNIEGAWSSKADYLSAHYQIIREDEIAPLRKSVAAFKTHPYMIEDNETHIYTHVTMKGLMLSPLGPAFRVEFSTERAGKQIRWDQSKRLMQGTMIAISSAKDAFRTSCKVGIVAARPLKGVVEHNPPQVDIFWGNHREAVFDPDEEYIIVEARTGFFEASRHMLVALQKLMNESFSLANHIVDLNSNIEAPEYVKAHSVYDLSPLLPPEETSKETSNGATLEESLQNVDILHEIPDIPESGMDPSQLLAFRNMMNQKIAIIQGPPGTGKTFVSVAALKVMLANLQPGDPPIIVAAQTNHALDQLLNHVLKFEPEILRLGGRCDKSNVAILKRTLYELKRANVNKVTNMFVGLKAGRVLMDEHVNSITEVLQPLLTHRMVTPETFLEWGVISQAHYDSLSEEGWAGEESTKDLVGLEGWLPPDQLVPIVRTPPNDTTLEMEEGEIEQEIISALDQETRGQESEVDKDGLTGIYVPFGRTHTGRYSGIPDDDMNKLLRKHKDLHGVPVGKRGDLYRWLLKRLGEKMRRKMKNKLGAYNHACDKVRLTKWSLNAHFIRESGIKLIGCTTTGLSKYRGLIAAVQPRALLIEEAAETKEGTIIAGMIETLQHLILVGDHQQLQANCNVRALEEAPYHMNISMFERLVNNSIGYVMLNKQRRMIPSIRKLLTIEPRPFYQNLTDHKSVLDPANRPSIPGMGGRNVWFFHHNWPEGRNPDSSRYNLDEAQFIAGAFKHLVLNGTEASKITVLTFYNGQRKRIVQELKSTPGLEGVGYFNVFTVDSYQGEENDVILLSLVRSNEQLGIGFLDNKNRLVVALSRARRGFYMFGNAITMTAAEETEHFLGHDPLWDPLIQHLKRQRQFKFDSGFPVTCQRHGKTIEIMEPEDWKLHAGGCDAMCNEVLPCGHLCPLRCHAFPESEVGCQQACTEVLSCGHGCSRYCTQACTCDQCPLEEPLAAESEDLRAADEAREALERFHSSSDVRSDLNYAFRPSTRSIEAAHNGSPERASAGRDRQNGFAPQSRPPLDPVQYPHLPHSHSQPIYSSDPTVPSRIQTTLEHEGVREWNTWDTQKADRKLMEESRRLTQAAPVGIKETYIPATFDANGIRKADAKARVNNVFSAADKQPSVPVQGSRPLNPAAKSFGSAFNPADNEKKPSNENASPFKSSNPSGTTENAPKTTTNVASPSESPKKAGPKKYTKPVFSSYRQSPESIAQMNIKLKADGKKTATPPAQAPQRQANATIANLPPLSPEDFEEDAKMRPALAVRSKTALNTYAGRAETSGAIEPPAPVIVNSGATAAPNSALDDLMDLIDF
ncbi:Helicase required for RNAi-mediated heterochromatin assembly [Lachnellula suecica]|uniref:Helicase required for RNAi-mediated heterochromatin assembly n=1 Tax=Lachnellula suecica TaxID=602035 RepID=A0A8T9C1G5_9HELO|nr:Helicase required for RNAi-mediated heterochromatin assembly [Lachnellula suecica]